MLTCRDKMFKSEEKSRFERSEEEVRENAVSLLDEIAMMIMEGEISHGLERDGPARGMGEFFSPNKKLELIYNEN